MSLSRLLSAQMLMVMELVLSVMLKVCRVLVPSRLSRVS